MPITPPVLTTAIISAGPELRGPVWLRLASILGIAVATWAQVPANLSLSGVTTGTIGGGLVNGTLLVPPEPLSVPAAVAAAGLLGVNAPLIAKAVGLGVSTAFTANATYQGVSTGVGVGSDVSRVTVSNGPSLVAMISSVATSQGFVGPNMVPIAAGIGAGVATLLLTGTGVGVVTGPTGPAPAAGTSISRVM